VIAKPYESCVGPEVTQEATQEVYYP
jgi:hypothetical protein